ncbi:SBBP repeat-containing protein [Spirosoma sp. BT702]|uniref:SBBP repeat-containing protein n=1 Tax=Spirosoma profusum TaxID=2771354 RepID=A0A927AR24_9BACT|nr:putative Ig domain-containing protein [Spirosoma profusum]MBD2699075.1 SBBP repeat-containing protein [Spirosoma profusum]
MEQTLRIHRKHRFGLLRLNYQFLLRLFVALISLTGFIIEAQAQNLAWTREFAYRGFSVAVDNAGNVYTTGNFGGANIDFDPGPGEFNLSSAGFEDIFVSKLDAAGNFVWAKRIGASSSDVGNSIAVDNSGNVYFTGTFQGRVDFDPGPGETFLLAGGGPNSFVCKLNSSGNFVWVKHFSGSGFIYGLALTLDNSGNIYTTGNFSNTADFDPGPDVASLVSSGGTTDIFVSKLTPSGSFGWARRLGGSNAEAGTSIAVDNSGNVYTTGYFQGMVDFDPAPSPATANLTSAGNNDIFISKLDASGDYVWAKRMGSTSDDRGQSIGVDNSGNVYTTGYFVNEVDFDPGSGTVDLTSAGDFDIFLSKLSSSGNYVWAKRIGGTSRDIGYSLILDNSNNIHLAGQFMNTVDFNPGTGNASLTSAGDYDGFVGKFDASGNYVWARKLGGTDREINRSVAADANNTYSAGYTERNDGGGNVYVSRFTSLVSPTLSNLAVSPNPVCAGNPVTFTATVSNVTGSYNFTLTNGSSPITGSKTATTFSQTLTASGSGTQSFTLTVVDNGLSAVAITSLSVNSAPSVSISASPSLTIDQGESTTLTASGADTYRWSTGETSAAISATETGPYSVTGTSGSCSSVASVNVTVTVVPPTITDLSATPNPVCANSPVTFTAQIGNVTGSYNYTLTRGSGPVSGTMSSATFSQTLTASGSGTQNYTLIVQDNGLTTRATTSLSVTSPPSVTITVSPSPIIISGQSATLTASGADSYTWSTGETTPAISVSATGVYTVTGTNQAGCSGMAFTFITVFSLPNFPPIATNDTLTGSVNTPITGNVLTNDFDIDGGTLVASLSVTTQNGSLTLNPDGSFTYTPNTGFIGQDRFDYQVCDNGTPSLCTRAIAFLNVLQATPTLTGFMANAGTVCTGSQITFTAQVSNVTGNYNYTLTSGSSTTTGVSSTTALSQTLPAIGTGTQSFTLTVLSNGLSGSATTSVTVTSLPVPTLSASSGGTLSCAQSSLTLTAGGGNQYVFGGPGESTLGIVSQNPSAGTAVVNVAGLYSVTVTTSGCSSVTTLTITQDNNVPSVSIIPGSATLNCATSAVSLSVAGSGTYRWNTGATTPTISATSASTYSVTLTATNGCTATTSVQVFQDTNLPTVTINPSTGTPTGTTLTCANPTVSLTAIGTGTYRWNTGAATQSISATSATTYSVTLTAANGCTATASIQVSQDSDLPTISINPSNAMLTCGTPTVSLSATGAGTYRWSTGATTQSISVSLADTYSVTLTAANSCTASASVQVTQDNALPTVSINPSSATLSCATSSASLSAVGAGSLRWSTGETTASISVSTATTYSVTLTGANGCTASASAIISREASSPSVSINPGSATLSCSSSSVSLSAIGAGTYRWNTGETTQTIRATLAATYSVTLTAQNGCTATANAVVSQDNTVPSVSISANPSLTIALGQSTTLTASGANNYQWNTGANTVSIVVNTSGNYSVTGATGSCQSRASVDVLQTNPPTGPFAITAVTKHTCQQIASNRYVISFTPQYSGLNGQPVSFSVVNELFPTTAQGPYTLQLYTDNPSIVLKAQQTGTPGEVSYTYNWLANCESTQPNTQPRVNQPLADQTARVGQAFGYTIPQTTFTDNESPHSLTLTANGLPTGLSFSPPYQIGGVPNVSGVSNVTVTATDPGGLSVSTSFLLTVVEPTATNTPPTLANPIATQVAIQGQPFSLNVSATFTDAQTPNALSLTAQGLPSGLTLAGAVISGTSSQSGTSTIVLIATDPGGLSATTSFGLTVQPSSATASAPFAITGVNPLTCNQIANNRYEISFTPRYSGLNGQPLSFWVVNELFPTTAPGPYSLQLYNDNPTIVLKAKQEGSPNEVSFTYNWLATCQSPQPNTSPRVNQPLTDQTAKVGQAFGYTIPQTTFTDNESPHSLVLSVTGLPPGMNFSPPTQIGGVPSVSGVSSVTVTATDPSGLSASTSFLLTVQPAGNPSGTFTITGVQTLSCVSIGANRRSIRFQPMYSGLTGEPVSFSIVNEMLPTTLPGPYALELYTDNAVLRLRAQQGNSSASYEYNWLVGCGSSRQGVAERSTELQVNVLGNPVEGEFVDIEISGADSQSVQVNVTNLKGQSLHQTRLENVAARERVRIPIVNQGVLLLQVSTSTQRREIRLVKQ